MPRNCLRSHRSTWLAVFAAILGWVAGPESMLILAQEAGNVAEPDPAEANAIVFVPEYNIVDCEAIKDKRKCRREREACLWINSESLCKKREQPISEHPGL